MTSRTTKRDSLGDYPILSTLIERRFEPADSRTIPTELAVDGGNGYVYAAQPTFKWRLDEPDEIIRNTCKSSYYDCSYTAFRIQVASDNTFSKVVYDSQIQRAPYRDENGYFTFKAPCYLDNGNYYWRVSMYNAKFKEDAYSTAVAFAVDTAKQQELNDHGYGTIKVAARYTGPSNVLDKATIYIEAFDSADFTGVPLARVTVPATRKNELKDAANLTNAFEVAGLKMNGTYYLRAFIDQDGDAVRDDWESWGRAESSVVLTNDINQLRSPLTAIYIEDADTDQDWIPDAYEYAKAGSSEPFDEIKDMRTAITGTKIKIDTLGDAGISTGLDGASLTVFESGSYAVKELGVTGKKTYTYDQIRAAVNKKMKPTSVKITAMTLNSTDNKITLWLDGEVALSLAGQVLSEEYGIAPSVDSVSATVKVYRKATLLDAEWTLVETIENVAIGKTQSAVDVKLDSTKIDLSSGFYKIEVEQ